MITERRLETGGVGAVALVVLGIDHDMALGRFAGAFGAQIGEVAQGQMDNAALAR